ncbi:hypothetical protein P7K49_008854, partial [Saguinus oedipus]
TPHGPPETSVRASELLPIRDHLLESTVNLMADLSAWLEEDLVGATSFTVNDSLELKHTDYKEKQPQ